MNVLVCVKQVPAKSVPMDKANGVLDRSQAGGQLNPRDFYALEVGLQIAEATGGTVTAMSMGPQAAEKSLRTALSMGASEAVLLCDKAFAGADVYATAFTLAQGIRALGGFDVVICGLQTTDGDTAQLPYSLAEQLQIPGIGWVKKLQEIQPDRLTVCQELSYGTQQATVQTPCLLAVGEGIGKPRLPSLSSQLKSKKKPIRQLGLADLALTDPTSYGLQASPTRVVSIREVVQTQKATPVQDAAPIAASCILHAWKAAKGGDV